MEEPTLKMRNVERPPRADPTVALTIVAHPDLDRIGETVLVRAPVEVTRHAPLFSRPGRLEAEPLSAQHVSRRPVVAVHPDDGGARVEYLHDDAYVTVDGVRIGGPIRFDRAALERGLMIAIEGRVGLWMSLRCGLAEEYDGLGLIGISEAIGDARDQLRAAAPLDATVLLRGETGTGKELAARAVHEGSPRANRRYFAVNLGALDPSVAASELFGHVRGAFTGAADARRGYFREVDRGTLFLDEIGEAPAEIQRALLRVLESGEVVPVGADRPSRVDVRIIAATDADLEDEIQRKTFRAPLFHRLAEVEIRLPALRERREDIAVLFAWFLVREAAAQGIGIGGRTDWVSTDLVARLLAWDWPGNVRELRNTAVAALVHSGRSQRLELPPSFGRVSASSSSLGSAASGADDRRPPRDRADLAAISPAELLAALEACDWRPEPAAELLGIAKTSIYQLIRANPDVPQSNLLERTEIEAALAVEDGDETRAARRLRVPKRGLLHRMKKLGLR